MGAYLKLETALWDAWDVGHGQVKYFLSKMVLKLLIVLLLLIHICESSRLSQLKLPTFTIPNNEKEWKKIATSVQPYIQRLPESLMITFQIGMKSFASTAITMIPFTILFCLFKPRKAGETLSTAFKAGVFMGADWAKISGVFVGAEYFMESFRGVSDRWNAYIGSGIGAAFLESKSGPIAMATGFFGGIAFLMILDAMMKPVDDKRVPSDVSKGGRKGERELVGKRSRQQ